SLKFPLIKSRMIWYVCSTVGWSCFVVTPGDELLNVDEFHGNFRPLTGEHRNAPADARVVSIMFEPELFVDIDDLMLGSDNPTDGDEFARGNSAGTGLVLAAGRTSIHA